MSDQANADSFFSDVERLNDLQAVDISETVVKAMLVNLLGQEKVALFTDRPLTNKIVAEGVLAAMNVPVPESHTVELVTRRLDTLGAFYLTTLSSGTEEARQGGSFDELSGMMDVATEYWRFGSKHKEGKSVNQAFASAGQGVSFPLGTNGDQEGTEGGDSTGRSGTSKSDELSLAVDSLEATWRSLLSSALSIE